jgi:hypothetical protein
MRAKTSDRHRAIELRKQGLSYKDIRKQVPVAKSSLSMWLSDLPLTLEEKRYLKTRNDKNISRGRINAATALRRNRLIRDRELLQQARAEFYRYMHHPLFFTGIALYWAEGSKRSNVFHFTNSDVDMVNLIINWVIKFCVYQRNDLSLRLYIHRPFANDRCEEFWSRHTRIPLSNFKNTVYKPSNLGIKKRPNYKGCVRIEVPRSTKHFKKMQFWQNMLVEHFKKQ